MDTYPGFADRHPDVPWRSMRGMRNRIAHGYFEINLDVVWDTVKVALPKLLERLRVVRESTDVPASK
ncbi:HepT-like ribonuclease domain-containing protein [Thiobacillus sp. 65-1402]|uniref:HepT-like ribonuclease domain-containing protein n=1 Tax=Thiobacillus sp. 65-1402 TaxID=1895861 RepID=UPI003441BEEE